MKIIKLGCTISLLFTILAPTLQLNVNAINNPIVALDSESDTLTEEQRNSIAMLNYLAYLNVDINNSSSSRLAMEEAYSSLVSNTYPNAVNERTQAQLQKLLNVIENYRLVDVKRERLDYIYEQNKAQALREAVPNPLGLLSSTQSFTLAGLVTSVVYMAIDSKASYDTAMAKADMEYLKYNWDLDDEASNALHESRSSLFNYMIDMVQEENLPGDLTLSEDAVNEFVTWKNNSNVTRRIQFLEANQNTYKGFGEYWAELASSYYEDEQYENCIKAIEQYQDNGARIFRKDHTLAQILPLGIASIEATEKNNKKCAEEIEQYVELLVKNLDNDDWALRYFAAQTYVEIAAKTKDNSYLEIAYELIENNINNSLYDEQQQLNNTYLADIAEKSTKNTSGDEKKDIKNYNKLIKEQRKVELPPVYQPLYLNLDLLFSLSDELDISKSEENHIDRILHGSNGNNVFLTEPLDDLYYFDQKQENYSDVSIILDKNSLQIPASLLSDESVITAKIKKGGVETTIDDWKIDEVDRNKSNTVTEFVSTYKSKTFKKYDFDNSTTVSIEINPVENGNCKLLKYAFKAKEKKTLWVIPGLVFERTSK